MLCLLLVCFLFPFIHRQFHAGSFQVGTAWRCQFTSRPRTFHSCLHMRLQFDPMASVTARIQPRNGVAKNTDKHGRRNRIHRPRVSQQKKSQRTQWMEKQTTTTTTKRTKKYIFILVYGTDHCAYEHNALRLHLYNKNNNIQIE